MDIVDVGAAERIEAVPAHTGPVWSLAALPDSSGAQQALRFVPAAPARAVGQPLRTLLIVNCRFAI